MREGKTLTEQIQEDERLVKLKKQIEELEREGKVFVFRPSEEITISRLEKDPVRLEQVYELGLKDAAAQWQALEEYLAK